jgi:hypothetical protein
VKFLLNYNDKQGYNGGVTMAFLVTSVYGAKPVRKTTPMLSGIIKGRISTLPKFMGHESFEKALKFYKIRSAFAEQGAIIIMQRKDLAETFLAKTNFREGRSLLNNISDTYGPYGIKAVINTKDRWLCFIKEDSQTGEMVNSIINKKEPVFSIAIKQNALGPKCLAPMNGPVPKITTYDIVPATGKPPEGEVLAYSTFKDDMYDCLKTACMDESIGSAFLNFTSLEKSGFFLVKKIS